MYRSGRLGARALGTFLVARVNAVDAGCTVFRSSRCRAGCVLGGLDGCEVRLCDPCALLCPVCVLSYMQCVPAARFADASRSDFLNF